MVVVKLSGGIGNQMFQYAFGKSLQEKRNIEVVYRSSFEGLTNRKFELNHFNITGQLINDNNFEQFQKRQNTLLKKIKNRFLGHYENMLVKERQYHFDPDLFNVPAECIVDGYFQSEKYFVDIEAEIRNEFLFKTPLTKEDKLLSDEITECSSIGIHVRRGDYLGNPLFPVYDLKYYMHAIKEVLKHVEQPMFFIFSNDYEWCRKNMHLDYPHRFVTQNIERHAYYDLLLMSQCKHNIIANSSFSWWGAWLNRNPDKIIIAPPKWVNQISPFFRNIDDIVPNHWIRIPDLVLHE